MDIKKLREDFANGKVSGYSILDDMEDLKAENERLKSTMIKEAANILKTKYEFVDKEPEIAERITLIAVRMRDSALNK